MSPNSSGVLTDRDGSPEDGRGRGFSLTSSAVEVSGNIAASAEVSRLARIFRSTPFRLGLIFSLIYLLVFSIAGVVFYDQMKEQALERLDRNLLRHYNDVNEVYQEFGIEAVVKLSQAKQNVPMQNSVGFHLSSSDGTRLAGNITSCPAELGWFEVPGSDIGLQPDNQYRFYGAKLGDHVLSLGRNLDNVIEMQQHAYDGFIKAFFIATALVLMASAYTAYRIQRRIGCITSSVHKVAAGDLSARAPVCDVIKSDIDLFSVNLNEALDRLEMNVEGMRQVSSDIAHDLKTPLNRLHIALDEATEKLQHDGIVSDELQRALEEATTINDTFAALLRIAQIEAGARRAKFKQFDLTRLLENIQDIYNPVAEESGQELVIADGLPDLQLWGDSDLLTQMLVNLIENAIRHCPEKTVISLEAGRSETGVWLSVADTGPGIPPEMRKKVFQRLFRLEQHRRTPGTGLGLSLVKAVAELHCGQVIVDDNNPGLRVLVQFRDSCRSEAGS